MAKYKVWDCKIVVREDEKFPSDFEPRMAAVNAVKDVGAKVLCCFSGWDGSLTKIEEEIVDNEVLALRSTD